MKILNAQQIREWDSFTIEHEPIASIDLMERAAAKCAGWLEEHRVSTKRVLIFCGKGNNGGDGLAIARLLSQRNCRVSVFILEFGHLGTEDFQINLERLHEFADVEIKFIQTEEQFPSFDQFEIIIDALLGSGLNRPLEGVTAALVEHINHSGCEVISIDVPSGLPVDQAAKGKVINASETLSFQIYKPAFLMPENATFVGNIHLLDIGLDREFYRSVETNYDVVDKTMISTIYKTRNRFSHKGNFGHALIIAGSYGKMGAAVLCNKACVRAGAGLTTTHIPKCGYEIMQTTAPEVMVLTDFNSSIVTKLDEDASKFSCIGIGPGIGTASETKNLLHQVLHGQSKTLVLDADALNIISTDKELLKKITGNSIITPHPREFERLFGATDNSFDRLKLAQQKAKELNVVIVLKGHHTAVITPGGKIYFNNTGNAGMAKGGSGDVLTGIITALMCQHYDSIEASILGVYLHGCAGDIAAAKYSREAMTAGDIIDNLGEAFLSITEN